MLKHQLLQAGTLLRPTLRQAQCKPIRSVLLTQGKHSVIQNCMSQAGETFFTTVGCMDGRVQAVVAAYGRGTFGAEYPDTITEAGLVGKLAAEKHDATLFEGIRFKLVTVSLEKHHSKGIIVHGHAECAGNPVADEQHKDDIRKSVAIIKSMVGSIPVIGVFVKRSSENPTEWNVAAVPDTMMA